MSPPHLVTPSSSAAAELPLIVEQVDAIVRVEIGEGNVRLYFFRDGQRLAMRCEQEGMLWTAGEGKFALAWNDWGQAERIVSFERLLLLAVEEDPFADDQQAAWWAQNRNMRDLKQP